MRRVSPRSGQRLRRMAIPRERPSASDIPLGGLSKCRGVDRSMIRRDAFVVSGAASRAAGSRVTPRDDHAKTRRGCVPVHCSVPAAAGGQGAPSSASLSAPPRLRVNLLLFASSRDPSSGDPRSGRFWFTRRRGGAEARRRGELLLGMRRVSLRSGRWLRRMAIPRRRGTRGPDHPPAGVSASSAPLRAPSIRC